jgi:menaquinone-dependent protoporphyrinogen IX oxidase
MCEFTERNLGKLAARPAYMWISCIRAVEPDGVKHAREFYIDHNTVKALDMRDIAIFAGRLNTDAIDWKERWLLASDYDGNLVPGRINYDFRDWNAIAAWALGIAKALDLKPTFQQPQEESAAQT